MIRKIDIETLAALADEAQSLERKRKNLNYHAAFDDPINRMLNAIEPLSYAHPHKHENPDKREVFILLTGKVLLVFFNDEGQITDHCVLDNKETFGVEIPPSTWHTIISLESGSVVYEVKDGPYSPSNDKIFAPWAPKEGDQECVEYMNSVLQQLEIQI